ncbi:MAG: YoaK family protein [Terrimicrobiaceae bacterium]|nr:YoaK family protein [Terrimicrobiaceae bacterium]
MNGIGNPRRNILLLLLSAAAGCVDAIAFVHAGVFPANMTGNSVVLAVGILHPETGGATLSALALLGFCLGAAVGARGVHSSERGWSRRVSLVLFGAGGLVLGCAIALPLTGGRFLPGLIVAAAAAMGLQSAAVQQIGIPGVATVFMTGTLTTAITRFVGAAREGDAPPRREEGPWLPASSWAAYFAGAFLGGLENVLHTGISIALAGILLIAVALAAPASRSGS